MKVINTMLILFFLFCFFPANSAAATTIQSKIDKASIGEKVIIEEGKYNEAITINKPITLEGKGDVVVQSCGKKPVITINGNNVKLKNMTVIHCGKDKENTAITITGSNHKLDKLSIGSYNFGIKLNQTENSSITNSKIMGAYTGNAIDLWKSNHNIIENISITDASDGIYLEQSHENQLIKNNIKYSRYGLHLMFSNDNVLDNNISKKNITGTMLMESKRTVVSNNIFASNQDNVNSQGLLLYLTSNTNVIGNEFASNRVGIFIEKASKNKIQSNKLVDNFIGVQFKKANENNITKNTFVGNVNDAQAIDSSNNQFSRNYWDLASKVDVNGDGKSEIAFKADPYFLSLTNSVPEYGVFFQSPGLLLLQNMLKSPSNKLLIDNHPMIHMTMKVEDKRSSSISLWLLCTVMIFAGITLYIMGRKRE